MVASLFHGNDDAVTCGWTKVSKGFQMTYSVSDVIVPTPLVGGGGGRNYILKWVFLVQSILADRYIHRREM